METEDRNDRKCRMGSAEINVRGETIEGIVGFRSRVEAIAALAEGGSFG